MKNNCSLTRKSGPTNWAQFVSCGKTFSALISSSRLRLAGQIWELKTRSTSSCSWKWSPWRRFSDLSTSPLEVSQRYLRDPKCWPPRFSKKLWVCWKIRCQNLGKNSGKGLKIRPNGSECSAKRVPLWFSGSSEFSRNSCLPMRSVCQIYFTQKRSSMLWGRNLPDNWASLLMNSSLSLLWSREGWNRRVLSNLTVCGCKVAPLTAVNWLTSRRMPLKFSNFQHVSSIGSLSRTRTPTPRIRPLRLQFTTVLIEKNFFARLIWPTMDQPMIGSSRESLYSSMVAIERVFLNNVIKAFALENSKKLLVNIRTYGWKV